MPPGPVPPQSCGPLNTGLNTMAAFNEADSRMQSANREYQTSPSGSYREQLARQNREQAARDAIQVLTHPLSFQELTAAQIEGVAADLQRRYNAAPSGSVMENVYRQGRDLAWDANLRQGRREVNCVLGPNSWRQLLTISDDYQRKYNAAPSGSRAESSARTLRDEALRLVEVRLNEDLNRLVDFRQAESIAQEMERMYQVSPSGSVIEAIGNRGRSSAYNAGRRALGQLLPMISQPQLISLEDEFRRRSMSASSGSQLERYLVDQRATIQRELSLRGPRW